MALIERPSVIADELGIVATKLDDALAAVVTILTERLQGGEPKQRAIAVVRNNMIDLRCDCRHAARKTHLAKRLLAQLMTPPLFPATMRIPIVPSNGSSATCCHSKKEERQSFARRADCPRALALFSGKTVPHTVLPENALHAKDARLFGHFSGQIRILPCEDQGFVEQNSKQRKI